MPSCPAVLAASLLRDSACVRPRLVVFLYAAIFIGLLFEASDSIDRPHEGWLKHSA